MTLPYKILIGLLIAAGVFASGFGLAFRMEHANCEAAKVKPLEQAIEHHDQVAAVAQVVEQKTATIVAKTEATFNGIQLGVLNYAQNHPLDSDCSIGADGLRVWNAANADSNPDPTGERFTGLPAAGPTEIGQDAGSAGGPRSDGQGVPPVPGASPGLDQLDQGHR